MLSKQHLEALLTRCMRSNADFAEIFEEEGSSEAITMLNNKVEDVSRPFGAGSGSGCMKEHVPYTGIRTKPMTFRWKK